MVPPRYPARTSAGLAWRPGVHDLAARTRAQRCPTVTATAALGAYCTQREQLPALPVTANPVGARSSHARRHAGFITSATVGATSSHAGPHFLARGSADESPRRAVGPGAVWFSLLQSGAASSGRAAPRCGSVQPGAVPVQVGTTQYGSAMRCAARTWRTNSPSSSRLRSVKRRAMNRSSCSRLSLRLSFSNASRW